MVNMPFLSDFAFGFNQISAKNKMSFEYKGKTLKARFCFIDDKSEHGKTRTFGSHADTLDGCVREKVKTYF